MNGENITIEPCDMTFGKYQTDKVTCLKDTASSLNSKWFGVNKAKDATKYYVWFNVGGAGVDPAPAGRTAIPVAIDVGASAETVAAAVKTAVNAIAGLFASQNAQYVTMSAQQPGVTTKAFDGTAPTGFTFEEIVAGSEDDLGYLDGDIEITLDEKILDIKGHQTGEDIIAAVRQGKTCEIKCTLLEAHTANLELALLQAGSAYTPGGGSEVVGWGSKTNSKNILTYAGKLVMHPHALGAGDKSRDMNFWRAYLKPGSIKYSGDNPLKVEVTFKMFTDTRKKSEVDVLFLGDGSQDFDA